MAGKCRRDYWLLKTEPKEWSWEDQQRSPGGVAPWDGVRNRQAVNHMKSMRPGDRCFFYHSGDVSGRRVVGVVEVVKSWYPTSPSRGSVEGAVDVRAVGEMRRPVELKEIKAEANTMKDFALLKQPRLSVVPVPQEFWDKICEMGGGYDEPERTDSEDSATASEQAEE